MNFENAGSTTFASEAPHRPKPWPRGVQASPAATARLDGLAAELAFLSAYGAPAAALIAAQVQARKQAIPPEAALLADGAIDETFFYQALAHHLGVPFIDREIALSAGARYPHSIHAGVAPLAGDRGLRWLAAPRGAALADLLRRARAGDLSHSGLAITTPTHLSRLVQASAAAMIARDASFGLASLDASFSAKEGPNLAKFYFVIAAIVMAAVLFAVIPAFASTALSLVANGLFLAAILLRLLFGSASVAAARIPLPLRTEDRHLPTYSIVVALHREARVVAQLAAALEAIDYPGIMAQTPQAI